MPKKTNKTKYTGDCSPNAENPAKTGNKTVDFAIGKIPIIKKWNTGFNLGKIGFVAKQTYNDTCKRKKINDLIKTI